MSNAVEQFVVSEASPGPWYRSSAAPEVYLDPQFGTLFVHLESTSAAVDAEFDEDEIFVLRERDSGRVVGFEIHAYMSYWQTRQGDLIDRLSRYAPDHSRAVAALAFHRTASTEVGSPAKLSATLRR